jgi:hypothetical protein
MLEENLGRSVLCTLDINAENANVRLFNVGEEKEYYFLFSFNVYTLRMRKLQLMLLVTPKCRGKLVSFLGLTSGGPSSMAILGKEVDTFYSQKPELSVSIHTGESIFAVVTPVQ